MNINKTNKRLAYLRHTAMPGKYLKKPTLIWPYGDTVCFKDGHYQWLTIFVTDSHISMNIIITTYVKERVFGLKR